MAKLILTIGISCAGKSYYTRNELTPALNNPSIVSTDTIRKELYGNASIQDGQNLVFQIAHKRIQNALKNNQDVIFDATNLTRKSRRVLFNSIGSLKEHEVEAHVIPCSYEKAMKNQENRKRKVPGEVILSQMSKFALPMFGEGFSKIIIWNEYNHEPDLLSRLMPKLNDIEQMSKWHIEDAGTHTRMTVEEARKMNAPEYVKEAVRYHDIGKIYTRSEQDGTTHFYGHANAGAYLYLANMIKGKLEINKEDVILPGALYYKTGLIAYHDNAVNGNIKDEILIGTFGTGFIKDLKAINEADSKGTIMPANIKDTSLIKFINKYPEWKRIITKPPLSINVKEDNGYVLLKYSQFNSDMNYRIVRECRGCILKQAENGWKYACRPFDKFFNYGEQQAACIDWNSARVTEKVDGSLCKCWHDNGEWHLSTNGTINAFQAEISQLQISSPEEISFGTIFERALGMDIKTFATELNLDKEYTYLFELTSPETRIVIPYDDGVYYLTRIHTETGKEDLTAKLIDSHLLQPKSFNLSKLDDVLEVVRKMGKDEEGVVVNDAYAHRIKVKSPEYLIAAHISNNRNISDKKIIEYIQEEKIDDFLSYCPEYAERAEDIINQMKMAGKEWENDWNNAPKDAGPKEFAEYARAKESSGFLFEKRWKNEELRAFDWMLKLMPNKIIKLLQERQEKEETVKENEEWGDSR